jgi:hypothetical protein
VPLAHPLSWTPCTRVGVGRAPGGRVPVAPPAQHIPCCWSRFPASAVPRRVWLRLLLNAEQHPVMTHAPCACVRLRAYICNLCMSRCAVHAGAAGRQAGRQAGSLLPLSELLHLCRGDVHVMLKLALPPSLSASNTARSSRPLAACTARLGMYSYSQVARFHRHLR